MPPAVSLTSTSTQAARGGLASRPRDPEVDRYPGIALSSAFARFAWGRRGSR